MREAGPAAANRRRALFILGGTACALAMGTWPANAGGTVSRFIKELGDKAILQLADRTITSLEREERFRSLLLENFDIPRICRFVLGRFTRTATPEDMAEFQVLYADIAVLTYAQIFASYAGETFRIRREVGAPGDRYWMVMTEIDQGNGSPPITLDWQVLVEGRAMAVVDVRIEGASMAITHRGEYTSVLEGNGGNMAALLSQLRAKIGKLRNEQPNG